MSNRTVGFASVMIFWLVVVSLPARAQPEPAAPSTDFFDTVDVNVVNVEVYVTDKKGRPVVGLTAADFEISEDGQLMKITNFFAAAGAPEPETPTPRLAAENQAVPLPAGLDPEDRQLSLVVFIDNANITPRSRNRVLEALRGSLFFNLGPDDQAMLVSYDGSVKIRHGLTRNPNDLAAAIEEVATGSPRGLQAARDRASIVRQMEQVDLAQDSGDLSAARSPDINDSLVEGILNSIKTYAQRRYREASSAAAALMSFVDSLSGLSGRKALIYVSDGLPLHPGEALFYAWEDKFRSIARQVGIGSVEAEAREFDAAPLFEELGRHANANQVTFYTVLASGGQSHTATPAERTTIDWTSRHEAVEASNYRGSMQILAEATGGVATLNTSAIGTALKRMQRDFGSYYSLGYVPPSDGDGKDHKIKVKVRDKSLKVRHREGYRNKTSDERMSDLTRSALLFDVDDNPLKVAVNFGEEKQDEKGRYVVPIMVKFPISGLLLLPQEHFHEGRVSIYVGARDDRGGMSPIQKMPAPIRIPNDKLLTALGQVAGFRVTLLMRPGEHSVVVGVRDELANVESTTRVNHTPGDS